MSCGKCNSESVKETVVATAGDNVPAEIRYTCGDCGRYLNFFSYGLWENPEGPIF